MNRLDNFGELNSKVSKIIRFRRALQDFTNVRLRKKPFLVVRRIHEQYYQRSSLIQYPYFRFIYRLYNSLSFSDSAPHVDKILKDSSELNISQYLALEPNLIQSFPIVTKVFVVVRESVRIVPMCEP